MHLYQSMILCALIHVYSNRSIWQILSYVTIDLYILGPFLAQFGYTVVFTIVLILPNKTQRKLIDSRHVVNHSAHVWQEHPYKSRQNKSFFEIKYL